MEALGFTVWERFIHQLQPLVGQYGFHSMRAFHPPASTVGGAVCGALPLPAWSQASAVDAAVVAGFRSRCRDQLERLQQ